MSKGAGERVHLVCTAPFDYTPFSEERSEF